MKKVDLTYQVRSFGRSYTRRFGLLKDHPYHKGLSLLQSRALFEIHHRKEVLSSELARLLQVDKGYMSRSITRLVESDVIKFQKNPADQREKILRLTNKGERLFAEIDKVSNSQISDLLSAMDPALSQRLTFHLSSAELLMGEKPLTKNEIQLRPLLPGDLGWVIGRHGEVYAQEFGWNMDFERLVGEIAVAFVAKHDPKKEAAWIAEARGLRLGCIFLVRENNTTAKLRILLVDPMARGLGLGTLLVQECIRFARKSKYRKLTLWTNSILHSARKIYQAEGFILTKEEAHRSFGHDLTGQFWELDLTKETLK